MCIISYIVVVDLQYRSEHPPPTIPDPNSTTGLYSGFTLGLLLVCFFEISVHSGFTLGPLEIYFRFTLRTKVWSRPVFYLTNLLHINTVSCIFQIHNKSCILRLLSGVFWSVFATKYWMSHNILIPDSILKSCWIKNIIMTDITGFKLFRNRMHRQL